MICPKCKSQLPAGAISCSKCGTKFKTKVCPYCKSQILFSSTSCPRCGKRLVQAAAPAAQYAAANSPSAKGGFRWWYILVCVGIFVLGAGVGAFGMRQSILNNVKSAFSEALNSSKPSSSSQSETGSTTSDEASTASSDYYFANNVLVSEDVRIEITNWKVIPVGEEGNEYGKSPVIAFWYNVTNLSGNENVTPSGAWIAMFSAAQDNDPNMINKLNVAALPDKAFLDTQTAKIKKGGTVECACAYDLSDTTTPVVLKATRGLLGEDLGEQTFYISE